MASDNLHVRSWDRALRVISSTARRLTAVGTISLLLILAAFSRANAFVYDKGYYVEATSTAYSQLPFCNAPGCTHYVTDGGQAYTTDYAVAQEVDIRDAQDGETWTWEAVQPDNTVQTLITVTYTASTGCFTWATGQLCDTTGELDAWDGPSVQDEQIGTWTLLVLDNGEPAVSHQFNLSGPPLGWLAITSPAPNQLIDLAQDQNWTATDATCPSTPNTQDHATAACFSATASAGNPINWTVSLSYATSGGHGPISDSRSFPTAANGTPQNEVYQNEGGQVTATASTTAVGGSVVQNSVTFYIDGPIGGILDSSITSELDTLYPASPSYPNDGTQHPNLMTGVGWVESTYSQFRRPEEGNANLYNGVDGKWPFESAGGGKYIGLMMKQTASNQASDPNAWNWTTNAIDAVNLLSGTPSPNEIQLATNFETWDINGFSGTYNKVKQTVPGHVGLTTLNGAGIEKMALVLYNGDVDLTQTSLSTTLQQQYWIPNCVGQTKKNKDGNLTCSTGWQWVVNDANQAAGVDYVASVEANLQ